MIGFFNFFKKLKLSIPPKRKYLYYDTHTLQIQKYLKIKNYTVLDTRINEINLFIILKVLLDFSSLMKLFKHNIYFIYLCKYIEFVNPKYVINFIDNDVKFYFFKKYFKEIKFISIQNGLRTEINDIFSKDIFVRSNNLACDYYLVFNKNIGKKLSNKINSKYIEFGSLKNNFYSKKKITKKYDILYISQFRNSKFIKYKNKIISMDQWITNHEKKLLNNVLKYCKNYNKKLSILSTYARSHDLFIKEMNYYKKITKNNSWKIIPSQKNSKTTNNYEIVDSCEITLTSWSTLGYESLARGNKVAFFQPKNFFNTKGRNFAWPYNVPKKGKFNSDSNKYEDVKRILMYLFSIKKLSWIKDSQKIQINTIKKLKNLDKLKLLINL